MKKAKQPKDDLTTKGTPKKKTGRALTDAELARISGGKAAPAKKEHKAK
jgi:hypothetical protein